jgi:hypothetical protein
MTDFLTPIQRLEGLMMRAQVSAQILGDPSTGPLANWSRVVYRQSRMHGLEERTRLEVYGFLSPSAAIQTMLPRHPTLAPRHPFLIRFILHPAGLIRFPTLQLP